MRFDIVATLSCLAVGLISITDTAQACINGIYHRTDPTVTYLSGGELMLDREQPDNAARQVLATFRKLKATAVGKSKLSDRALRVAATALVRLDGDFEGFGFRNNTPERRTENLQWATQTLESLSRARPNDANLQTQLAEAWAKDAARHTAALASLTTLEEQERVTSSYGYAALARLRRQRAAESPAWLSAPLRALAEGSAVLAEAHCRKMSLNSDHCGDKARG